jgi:hypothetical protein
VREPATSCTACGRALAPGGVLYTSEAEIVCEACLATAAGPPSGQGFVAPARTRFERARSLQLWSMVWLGLAMASVYALRISRTLLRTRCPLAVIETPEPFARVPANVTVRGRVAGAGWGRPFWVVARSGQEFHCPAFTRRRIIAAADGTFSTTMRLNGDRGQRYWVQIVAADEHANAVFQFDEEATRLQRHMTGKQGGRGCRRVVEMEQGRLPAGAVPVASLGVTLAEDNPWLATEGDAR